MSRKVIYRAWDKKYNVMLEGFGISAEGDHIGMSYEDSKKYYTEEQLEMDMGGHFGSGDDWTYILNDFELMQFTGLCDNDENEIFEGDILQYGEDCRRVVIFEQAAFHCRTFNYKKGDPTHPLFFITLQPDKHMKKIGNIYESKDLL